MYQNQNYNPGSPLKQHPSSPLKGGAKMAQVKGSSPVASPLKQPRFEQDGSYRPPTKAELLGKPIEIIQGK